MLEMVEMVEMVEMLGSCRRPCQRLQILDRVAPQNRGYPRILALALYTPFQLCKPRAFLMTQSACSPFSKTILRISIL